MNDSLKMWGKTEFRIVRKKVTWKKREAKKCPKNRQRMQNFEKGKEKELEKREKYKENERYLGI